MSRLLLRVRCSMSARAVSQGLCISFFFFKQKTAYEIDMCLEFRRVLFRSEEADIVLAGVSRTSKTPTSIYLANRGYKTANIPIVPESPPPSKLFELQHPIVVGLTTSADQIGRASCREKGENSGVAAS